MMDRKNISLTTDRTLEERIRNGFTSAGAKKVTTFL
jgi:hypothetical protein